jgi:5-methylcytosine-specific restriction endonuclease McrA
MNEVASIIAELVRAGTDPELVGRVAAAFANVRHVDEQAERRRAADRARKAAWAPQWGEIRALVLSVYEPSCVYCGADNPTSVDHVVPVAAGGVTDLSNLVPACSRCNSSKRDRDLKEWLACQ